MVFTFSGPDCDRDDNDLGSDGTRCCSNYFSFIFLLAKFGESVKIRLCWISKVFNHKGPEMNLPKQA